MPIRNGTGSDRFVTLVTSDYDEWKTHDPTFDDTCLNGHSGCHGECETYADDDEPSDADGRL